MNKYKKVKHPAPAQCDGSGAIYSTPKMGVITQISTRGEAVKAGLRLLWLAVRWHKFHLNLTGVVSGRTYNH